ncbi:hypothetical protein PR048_011122 [Dryococelus australis]|uniref:Uncharacterized protein n=1 Tax=Dryococelus australis TaxID=614101 RepID=A0ABQ9HKN4_9NEOP|nr:hypothetical protein PR048_011122 [Dryococelus australis]
MNVAQLGKRNAEADQKSCINKIKKGDADKKVKMQAKFDDHKWQKQAVRDKRDNPYVVHSLQTGDFYDYKTLAHDLHIMYVRIDDKGDPVDWTTVRQIMVQGSHSNKVFFADSHLTKVYGPVTLKRGFASSVSCTSVPELYQNQFQILSKKFRDLMALCHGETPIVSFSEHILFYESLPHQLTYNLVFHAAHSAVFKDKQAVFIIFPSQLARHAMLIRRVKPKRSTMPAEITRVHRCMASQIKHGPGLAATLQTTCNA